MNTHQRLTDLFKLRAQLDREIAREAHRQGVGYPSPESHRVGYVVLPAPTLRHAADQLAAAAERWAR